MTDQPTNRRNRRRRHGHGRAQSLLRNGWRPYVRDINPAREAEARSAGAIVCTSAQELATHCDIVITLVVDCRRGGATK